MRRKEGYIWQFIRLKKRDEIGKREKGKKERKRKRDIALYNANIIQRVEREKSKCMCVCERKKENQKILETIDLKIRTA